MEETAVSRMLYHKGWRKTFRFVWLLLDDRTLIRWSDQIRRSDDRFRAATVDDDGYVLSQFHRGGQPDMWWWRRYPRILTGDLGETLRAAGAV